MASGRVVTLKELLNSLSEEGMAEKVAGLDTVQPSTSIPPGHAGHLDTSGVIWLDDYRRKKALS